MSNGNIRAVINSLHRAFGDRKFQWMNHGGCGVWAAIAAKELLKRGIPVQIKVAGWRAEYTKTPLNEIRPELRANTTRNWSIKGVGFGHVVLQLEIEGELYYVDSERIKLADGTVICGGEIPVYEGDIDAKDMAKLVSRQEGWNDRYDRKLTPAVRALIKKNMKQLDVIA